MAASFFACALVALLDTQSVTRLSHAIHGVMAIVFGLAVLAGFGAVTLDMLGVINLPA